MPLFRYFTVAGGALLALLFVVSGFFPETETVNRGDVARPVIRIASDRVGPPRVDIDTSSQAPAIPASVPDIVQAPAQVAEARPGSSAPTRAVSAPARAVSAPTRAVAIRIEHKTKVAKRPDRERMAANPPQGSQPFRSTWWPL
jgi:hypothetical protein